MLVASFFLCLAQAQEFETGPPAEWIEPVEIGALDDVPVDELYGGTYCVLIDTQDRFADGGSSTFCDSAWYVHDTQGVQNGSQISINFDPSFQTLTIHSIEVVRGGVVHDRLVPDQIEVLQREEELDARIYDGSKTALAFVDDVRPGDLVRHAYTIEGSNPSFAGHYMRAIYFASSVPMGRLRHRLLWPAHLPLTLRTHGATPGPVIVEHDGVREYSWEVRDRPALVREGFEPEWYVPYPWIQFTSFQSWSEVARWEAGLLDPPCEVGPDLAAEIERIRGAYARPREQAWAATRFVQDEVRYLGIELGAGAYEARLPNEVFARRFGDCKDKSLLLATILRELQIEARIGIVSWGLKRKVADHAPSSALFDHVIVRIDLEEGSYWVDPTESLVGGDLASYEPPPFGRVLVAHESTVDLERIANEGRPGVTRVTHRFQAADVEGPVALEIESEYVGRPANELRESYGWTTPRDYTEACREYYATYYESAETVVEVTLDDDRAANVLSTKEYYRIPEFWTEYDGDPWGGFYAMEIDYLLPVLENGARVHPLAVSHPVHYEQSIEVQLSDDWWFESESEVIDNGAFRFTFDADFDDSVDILRLQWTYESKTDHVLPADVDSYLDDLGRASELTHYEVALGGAYLELMALLAAGLILGGLAALLLVGLVSLRSHLVRRDRSFEEQVADVEQASPWLTLWTRPRATMRAILESPRSRGGLALVAAVGVLQMLDQAAISSWGDQMRWPTLLLVCAVGGSIGGVLSLLIGGLILTPLGRLLGGQGRAHEVRAAIAWSAILPLWFGLSWLPDLAMARGEMFTSATPRVDANETLQAMLLSTAVLQTVGGIWAAVVFFKCLAEAHRFSSWRALATALIPFTLLGLLAAFLAILRQLFA